MKIILVCIENFQEYILDNIKNLQLFGNRDIVVLTNRRFFDRLESSGVTLYAIEDLDDMGFGRDTKLDRHFRGGFWMHCSARFFYLYSYIRKFGVCGCIHLENDVMAYVNFDQLTPQFTKNKVYATFDCPKRVIPGILYIPNVDAFLPIVARYDFAQNDMENLARYDESVIEPLPIIPARHAEYEKLWQNYIDSIGVIYDAAAMGQYLGGIDPRNQAGDTRGFVNETCLVKYDQYAFYWIAVDGAGLYAPHVWIDGRYVRIVNLHIHGKELRRFMADRPLETKYIAIL